MKPKNLLLFILVTVTAFGATQAGTLNVVHGIPGVEVDVCAAPNGQPLGKAIPNFNFKDIEALELPEGAYDAAVVFAGDPCTAPIAGLSAQNLFLPGDANVSVVASQLPAGGFGLTLFSNETSPIRFGSELIFRHAAAAPTVDVRYGRFFPIRVVPDLSAGGEGFARYLGGRARISVNLPGDSDPVLGPAAIRLRRAASNIVYVVGSAGDGTLDVIQQTIDRRRSFGSRDDESSDD